jgi:hypothetical protein
MGKGDRDALWFVLALVVFAVFMAVLWCGTPGGGR